MERGIPVLSSRGLVGTSILAWLLPYDLVVRKGAGYLGKTNIHPFQRPQGLKMLPLVVKDAETLLKPVPHADRSIRTDEQGRKARYFTGAVPLSTEGANVFPRGRVHLKVAILRIQDHELVLIQECAIRDQGEAVLGALVQPAKRDLGSRFQPESGRTYGLISRRDDRIRAGSKAD
jgi:hypothetical protein